MATTSEKSRHTSLYLHSALICQMSVRLQQLLQVALSWRCCRTSAVPGCRSSGWSRPAPGCSRANSPSPAARQPTPTRPTLPLQLWTSGRRSGGGSGASAAPGLLACNLVSQDLQALYSLAHYHGFSDLSSTCFGSAIKRGAWLQVPRCRSGWKRECCTCQQIPASPLSWLALALVLHRSERSWKRERSSRPQASLPHRVVESLPVLKFQNEAVSKVHPCRISPERA